ncbi:uncharacterized protein LOC106647062 [Copidosoma floridanum]|uniref:uncharacterized protein LOC106647062 n=1 Tax=Copidosoma floridanum TaxID=29053 RepID=UPI0006C9D8AB|nr:uncharacterized protein LOC106647062 [Copidosoma floridanum]
MKKMFKLNSRVFLISYLLCHLTSNRNVSGHGRLMDPPARNSMWRFGFPNPVNYNDNELFCGGYAVQWGQNEGKCGICGDPYHVPVPRPHEAGGIYGKGTIVRHYQVGQLNTVRLWRKGFPYHTFNLSPINFHSLNTITCYEGP